MKPFCVFKADPESGVLSHVEIERLKDQWKAKMNDVPLMFVQGGEIVRGDIPPQNQSRPCLVDKEGLRGLELRWHLFQQASFSSQGPQALVEKPDGTMAMVSAMLVRFTDVAQKSPSQVTVNDKTYDAKDFGVTVGERVKLDTGKQDYSAYTVTRVVRRDRNGDLLDTAGCTNVMFHAELDSMRKPKVKHIERVIETGGLVGRPYLQTIDPEAKTDFVTGNGVNKPYGVLMYPDGSAWPANYPEKAVRESLIQAGAKECDFEMAQWLGVWPKNAEQVTDSSFSPEQTGPSQKYCQACGGWDGHKIGCGVSNAESNGGQL